MHHALRVLFVFQAIAIGTPIARAANCREERGAAAAQILVNRCIEVSPATHPPCNALNDCDLIESEIRRGCGFFTEPERPAYCKAYRE